MKPATIVFLLPIAMIQCAYGSQIKPSRFSDRLTHVLGIDKIPIGPDAYLKFKKASRLKGASASMPQDEFHHIYQLEKMFKVSDMIANRTGFTRANASAALVHQRLSSALLTSGSVPEAVASWRSIDEQVEADPQWKPYYAISEAMSEDIESLHGEARAYSAAADSSLIPDLVKRVHGAYIGSHSACDARQVAQTPHPLRTLARFDKTGIVVSVSDEGREELRSLEHSPVPLIESAKNKRILSISGHKNSKVALLVHDHFDHYFTFKFLEREGILGRYSNFIRQIGNPAGCDILSREAELLASIAYDYRYTSFPRFKQPRLFSLGDIEDILSKGHSLSDNQGSALKICAKRARHREFVAQLERVVSGVCLELMQQRVKNGVIKVLDKDKQPVDVLRALDPEYMAFIIETVNAMDHHKGRVHQQLRNTQLAVEDILQKSLASKSAGETILTASHIDSFSDHSHSVPAHRVDWIERNLGAVSDRNSV